MSGVKFVSSGSAATEPSGYQYEWNYILQINRGAVSCLQPVYRLLRMISRKITCMSGLVKT